MTNCASPRPRQSGVTNARLKMGPECIPASLEALLAPLPRALRDAVIAHLDPDLGRIAMGTSARTNDNAVGI